VTVSLFGYGQIDTKLMARNALSEYICKAL
jgi:hypothetical protein